MRVFFIYALVSIGTILLATQESAQHMGLHGFIAIFICQPWLLFCWILGPLGLIPDFSLNVWAIIGFSGLNMAIWILVLVVKHRKIKETH